MTKETKTGVSKIVITIAGREIVCTPQQIKDLKDALEKMYSAPQQIVKEVRIESDKGWWPPVTPRYRWNEPTCKSASAGEVSLLAD